MKRVGLSARGAVQGVGFRPTVYRLATRLGLGGRIRNDPAGVDLEVEGPPDRVEEFLRRLPRELPRHALVRRWERRELTPCGEREFAIVPSGSEGPATVLVLPDLATCPDCLRELRDPSDRRYRYPFLNCTLCGPRYTIVRSLPYDRAHTTMQGFPMCPACRVEYEDPLDRRFHAQPTACPSCGPRLSLAGRTGEPALAEAVATLRRGEILALKGLGGFQLLVDARSSEAVHRLRQRKRRDAKPLAVMAPDLGWVASACHLSPAEERLLTSAAAPIVLLRPRRVEVAREVAPGCARLGVLLPYTPLHHLLLGDLGFPVVATSGNLSEEPLCIDEDEARARLGGIADVFLVHDRPIARPVDDSVAWVVAGQEAVLRRARGYAPMALPLGFEPPATLAVGGHQKGTVALTVAAEVVVSQHLGDLDGELSRENFRLVASDLQRLFQAQPASVACDLHPDYASTLHARGLGLPVTAVQHHAAHVYSLILDRGLEGPVLGVAWDGTGLGTDGTVWGGEFLRVDGASWERVAHLRTFRLPGGEAAVREPRRSALGVLHELGLPVPEGLFEAAGLRVLERMLERGVASPVTSSAGRLFDAVSSLLGLRHRNGFEGQAAMELEAAAAPGVWEPYPFVLGDWGPAVMALLEDPAPIGVRAARFHETMAALVTAVALQVGEERVALTGGCFQNALLTERCVARLREAGFRVSWHRHLPPNDGGLSAGQALAAALIWREGGLERCALPSPAGCSK